nr:hypothetical protein [Tanacetum cinerariifolium]
MANKVKSSKLRRLRKVGASKRVESSDDMEDPSISAAAPTVVAAYTRRRKGVIIRDPEEELSLKTPAKTPKLKDKGKGMTYAEICPIFQARFDENIRKRLEVVDDEDDDVFIEATPLARKLILLVERRYSLSRFTLEQLVNVTRLQVEEENSLSPQVVSAAKLPILTPNEFDLWKMRIEQYFLITDYSLWEVILNGDSPVPTRIVEGVVQPVAPTTAE